MQPKFADALEVLLPQLDPCLVTPEVRENLRQMARSLAPSARGGFEVRLNSSSQVDLQQCIFAREGRPQYLRAFLKAQLGPHLSSSPKWSRMDDFLADWADSSTVLHREVPELWLELDNLAEAETDLPLSLFLGFQAFPVAASERFAVAREALNLLSGPTWEVWQTNLRRCFDACPAPAFASHLGTMLGRTTAALRLNIKGLQLDTVGGYLQDVGWPGKCDEVIGTLASLDCLGGFTICLDIGEQLALQLGFECVPKRGEHGLLWADFLKAFVQKGWCTQEKRNALLQWPGFTTPGHSEASWPASLIRATLLAPPDQFMVFERKLSHIKITLRSESPLEAKGYFGFDHVQLQLARAH